MNENKDNVSLLYNGLLNKGYTKDDLGDEATFREKLSDEGSRKELYDYVTNRGDFRIGDYETYNSRLNESYLLQQPTTDIEVSQEQVKQRILDNKPDYFKPKKATLLDRPLNLQEKEKPMFEAPNVMDTPYETVADAYDAHNQYLDRVDARAKLIVQDMNDPERQKSRNESKVRGLMTDIDADLADIEEKITSRKKALRGVPNAREDRGLAEYRGDRSYLEGAKELMEESQKLINAAKDNKDGTFVGGVLRGTRDKAFDVDTWTMGISDLVGGLRLKKVLADFEEGKELTPAQEKLLDATITNMTTTALLDSDLGAGYKAGQVFGESLPFMLEMMINPISASGNALAKRILNAGLKKYAKNKAAQVGARLVGDAAASAGMAATTGMAGVLGDTVDRLNKNYKLGFDRDGNFRAIKEGDTTFGEALGRSFTTRAIENQSEMIFNAFKGVNGLLKGVDAVLPGGVNKFFDMLSHNKVADAYRYVKNSPVFRNYLVKDIRNAANIGGLGEEYLEEVYNNLANFAIGEMEWKDVVSLDNNIETLLGLAPTQAMFAMLGLGGAASMRYQTRRTLEDLKDVMDENQREKLEGLMDMGLDAKEVDVRGFIRDIVGNQNYTIEDKRNLIKAAYTVAQQRGIDQLTEADTVDKVNAENSLIDSMTDTQTGNYAQVTATLPDGVGGTKEVVGNVVGWFGEGEKRSPIFVADGLGNTEENRMVLKQGEWNPETFIERPAEEVKAINEEMVREEVAEQAEREAKYAPQVLEAEMQQDVPFETADAIYTPKRPMAEGNGWVVDIQPKSTYNKTASRLEVKELTNDEFRDILQAEIDAQDLSSEATDNSRTTTDNHGQAVETPTNVASDESADDDIKPVGKGIFGYIYNQFKGKFKEGVNFLIKKRSGNLQGVFNRKEVGDIDLVWGNNKAGLGHIITKHVINHDDFSSVNEAVSVIDDVVNNGDISIQKDGRVAFAKDGYRVAIERNEGGNWIVTALDTTRKKKEKKRSEQDATRLHQSIFGEENGELVSPQSASFSENKDSEKNVQSQANEQKPLHEREKDEVFRELGDKYGEKMPHKVAVTAKAFADDLAKAQKNLDKAIEDYDNAPYGREAKAEKAKAKAQLEFDKIKKQADFWSALDAEIKQSQAEREAIVNPSVEMDMSNEPQTTDEFIAQQLAAGNIILNSDSFMDETGFGNKEKQALNGGKNKMLGKDGISIEQAGERLMEMDRENGTNFFDQTDANAGRDALINFLGSVGSRKEINDYIKNNREQQAQKESEGLRNEIADAIESNYHMTPEEYATLQEVESVEKPFGALDVAIKDAIFVEAYEEYEQALNSERNDEGRTNETVEGNGDVLSEERTDNKGRTSERQGERFDVSEGAVQQNDGAQETEQVEEPLAMQEGESHVAFAERVVEENRRKPLRNRAKEWENKTGVKVNLIENLEDVTNEDAANAIREGKAVTGWFEESTGEVCFYMPFLESESEVDSTYIHEVVSHKGLRGLLGEKFDAFCDEVWETMSVMDKAKFINYPGVNGNTRAAADEYIAHLAENIDVTESAWGKLAELIKKFLKAIGLEPKMTDADIANTIKKSYQRLLEGSNVGAARSEGTRFKTLDEINTEFNDNLQKQIDGTLPNGYIYQLGSPSAVLLSTGIADVPIELNSTRLEDKSKNFGHDYDLSELKDLAKAIHKPMAIFAYGDKSKAQNIIVEIQHEGKNFIVGLSIKPKVGGQILDINSIRNVFPKDNAEWLNWISQGKMLYADKERIQNLINQQRTNLADVDYLDLDSIANIVKDFPNPTLPEEKTLFKVAYHGSGAEFDKFDHSKMGSGAGSQVFGWGTYVTDSDKIGRDYADMSGQGEGNRHLYEVEIPDARRGNYIVWGNNVTDAAAKKVFDGIYQRVSKTEDYDSPMAQKELKIELDGLKEGYGQGQSGIWKDLYGDISTYLGSDKEASLFLRSLGYVGIEVPAGSVHDGVKNYVIFDESNLNIVNHTRFRMTNAEKEALRDSYESKALFDYAKKRFGRTFDLREAGYVLPDGSMLDFSGRHEMAPGSDTSFLRGDRTADHRAIVDVAYDFEGEETGFKTDMADFINRGAIRIDGNSGAIDLTMKPTSKQKDILRRLIQRMDGDVWIDFSEGWDSEHYVEYAGVKPVRVLSDIDKYYDEGIKPEGNIRFRIKREDAQKQVDAFTSKYNSKPVTVVESLMSDEELERAIPILLAEDIRKRIDNGLIGGYSTIADKIYIFADNVSEDTLEDTLFHENLHPMFKGNPIVEEFYNNFKTKYPEQAEMLAEGYEESEIPEELFVTALAAGMQRGNFKIVDAFLSEYSRKELGKTLKSFGYDYEQERGRRNAEGNNGESSEVARDKEVDERSGRKEDGEEERTKAEQSEELRELFERVADEGLRGVVGDTRYNLALIELYHALPQEERLEVAMDALNNQGGDVAAAVDRYLESKDSPTLWEKAAAIIRELLRKAGIDLDLTQNDVKYLLWRSKKPINRNSIVDKAADIYKKYQLGVGEYAPTDGGNTPDGGGTRFRVLDEVNEEFNKLLGELNEANADKIELSLGNPSDILLSAGVEDKPMKLYGNKVIKKMKKHGFSLGELMDLPKAVAEPIAVFENYGEKGNRSILTELKTEQGNFLVTLSLGKGHDIDFNIVTSVFGKGDINILDWIEKGYGVYYNKKKTLDYLHHSALKAVTSDNQGIQNQEPLHLSALYAEALSSSRLDSATKIVESFENPKVLEGKSVKNGEGTRFRVKESKKEKIDIADKRDAIIKEYDKELQSKSFNFQEAFQDRMLSVKVLMDLIEKETGKKAKGFEDAYKAENQLGSINKPAQDKWLEDFYKPLLEELNKLTNKYGRKEVERYIYCKSGLERNEVLRQRDADETYKEAKEELDAKLAKKKINQAQYDTLLKMAEDERKKTLAANIDYSGIRGLLMNTRADELFEQYKKGSLDRVQYKQEVEKLKANEANVIKGWKKFAENQVAYLEKKASQKELDALWDKINAATNETLRIDFESGMIDRATYEAEKNMMKYYVPLRNWENTTAEDMYEYRHDMTQAVSSNQKRAGGRKTQADNPIATIALMAQNAIVRGNRNKMKQDLFNFVANRPTALASIRNVWYVYDAASKQWEAKYADTSAATNQDEINQIIEQFEADMQVLAEQGKAFKGKMKQGMYFQANRKQKDEHVVTVMINGKEYGVYINGNPRAAQAMNGMTNAEGVDDAGKWIDAMKRWYGAGLTSWNPDFIIPNMVRDTIHATTMTFLDKGALASAKYAWNVPKMFAQISKEVTGISTGDPKLHKYFEEFVKHGGETGYTAIHTLEDYKKEYNKLIDEAKGVKATIAKGGKATIQQLAKILEAANRIVEDTNRFNAYVTSRESGENIKNSIDAAKNITVNFNRKGALSANNTVYGKVASLMSRWILFFNPSVQGIYQLATKSKANPKRATALGAMILSSGFLVPMLNDMLVAAFGDGDEDDYWNQSDYKRRNNFMLFVGDGYVSIPLPPVLRELYGIGDIMYGVITGHNPQQRAIYDTLKQVQSAIGFVNLLPEVSQEPDMITYAKGFAPDLAAPVLDIISNTNFMGRPIAKWTDYNEYDPEYMRVYKGVSPHWVELSKLLNEYKGDEGRRSDWWGNFINPAMMEHLFTSYTGGIGKTINNLAGMAIDAATGDTENIDVFRKTPIVPRFYTPNDEKTVYPAINRKYYEFNYQYNIATKALKRYNEAVNNNEHPEWQKYIDEMKKNGELEFIEYFKKEQKKLKKLQDKLKENPNDKEQEKKVYDKKAEISLESFKILSGQDN